MKIHRSHVLPIALAGLVSLLGISISIWLGNVESRRYQKDVESRVLQELSTLRAAVEGAINTRVYLTLGLRAYVSTNPDVTREEFARFAAALMQEGNGIRSVTLIKDSIISDVYPREGNESAIGLRLLELPDQRADVLHAMETGEPWLSAPIKLFQGGEAFVNRAPVFVPTDDVSADDVSADDVSADRGTYWGLVSILISKDVLLADIVRQIPSDLQVGIRAQMPDGEVGEYFLGDASIESAQPLTLQVDLPTGSWQVAGVPIGGWPIRAPLTRVLQWLGGAVSIFTGLLTGLLLQSNRKYQAARNSAEAAVVQLSRKNEDLEAFIHTASHDLRSPLRHIQSFTEFLAEDAATRLIDEDKAYLLRVQQAADRMMRLLDSLLRFARTGTDAIRPEMFPLEEVIEEIIALQPKSDRSRISVSQDLPSITADRSLLSQVFQNLVENGLKYHPVDQLSEVQVTGEKTKSEVIISVSDDGIGMRSEQLSRVFKAGVRGVSPSEFSGSGFGLAICERIVRAHGGRIWAESTFGKGSTFFVSLPIG